MTPSEMARKRWAGVSTAERAKQTKAASQAALAKLGKPTPCKRCGVECPSIRAARRHCPKLAKMGA